MELDYLELLLAALIVGAAAIFIGTYRLQQALTRSENQCAKLEWENYKLVILLESSRGAERRPEENVFPTPPDIDDEAGIPPDYDDLPF